MQNLATEIESDSHFEAYWVMVMIGWKPVIQYLLWPAERELLDTNILIHPKKKLWNHLQPGGDYSLVDITPE